MEGCTINIDGYGEYHIPCNQVEYISDGLINSSNNTITAYKDLGVSTTLYPRIVIPVGRYAYYQSSNTSTTILDTDIHYQFNWVANYYREKPILSVFVQIALLIFVIMRSIKK